VVAFDLSVGEKVEHQPSNEEQQSSADPEAADGLVIAGTENRVDGRRCLRGSGSVDLWVGFWASFRQSHENGDLIGGGESGRCKRTP